MSNWSRELVKHFILYILSIGDVRYIKCKLSYFKSTL